MTAKLLGVHLKDLHGKLWVSGVLLTIACIGAVLAISFSRNERPGWLELPVAAVAVMYMVYCAVQLAKQSQLRVYGNLFFWVWIAGSIAFPRRIVLVPGPIVLDFC